jgi:hypothetical protein
MKAESCLTTLSFLVGNVQLLFAIHFCILHMYTNDFVHTMLKICYVTIFSSSLLFSTAHMMQGFVCETLLQGNLKFFSLQKFPLCRKLGKPYGGTYFKTYTKEHQPPDCPSFGSINLSLLSFLYGCTSSPQTCQEQPVQ